MSNTLHILAISGSLRTNSYHTMLLKYIQNQAPDHLDVHVRTLERIPLYNGDLEQDTTAYPQAVMDLQEEICKADGVILAVPEYNYSVPGVLKNTIDWLSRPPKGQKIQLNEKPVALCSVSAGMSGGMRAQYHMRQTLVHLNTITLNKPEIFVPMVAGRFNEQGILTDEPTAEIIWSWLLAFEKLIRRAKLEG